MIAALTATHSVECDCHTHSGQRPATGAWSRSAAAQQGPGHAELRVGVRRTSRVTGCVSVVLNPNLKP
eukprot:3298149-Rhodomonas_salina.4